MVLDASVKKTCMTRTEKGEPHPHLLQAFTWRWSQVTCPDRWTSLTAWIEPPTSTWNWPNWLSLAPKHTGAKFNFRQGDSVGKWKTLKKNNSRETGQSKSISGCDCSLVYDAWTVLFFAICYGSIKEPPTVHQVNPENKSFGKQRINRNEVRRGWFHQTRRMRKIFTDFTGISGRFKHALRTFFL